MENVYITRLAAFRKIMNEKGVDYYMIPTADFHNSEYVHDYFKCREFMSGFTGSNGTLVISKEEVCLWTDGRYFIQAERELAGSGIVLMRMNEPGVPKIVEYLKEHMKAGECLGFDGRCVSASQLMEFKETLKDVNYKMDEDLVDVLWKDRPDMPATALFLIPDDIAGVSVQGKLEQVRAKLEDADSLFLSKLDDIMWLFNVRANDVECNPVALSYSYISKEKAVLFLQEKADKSAVVQALETAGIEVLKYEEVFEYLAKLSGQKVLVDKQNTSAMIADILCRHCEVEYGTNPTTLMKAMKNEAEIKYMREYYREDSVVLTRFIYWLKHHPDKKSLNEWTVGAKLDEMRARVPGFIELSFPTISAYQANAAMMHYEATESSHAVLDNEGFYLVDSGAQYFGATTDVTRTISLGALTDEQRKHYTLTALGMLDLMEAQWLYGCTGRNLDILARHRLWKEGIDYKCGTGHGIGFILNVHEGPQNIRWKYTEGMNEAVLEPGMVISDEPGVYLEGKYGIRIENILLTKNMVGNSDGQFMAFDNLTYVPLDRAALDTSYMNEEDLARVNRYQKSVYDAVSPRLSREEAQWLKNECAEIFKDIK